MNIISRLENLLNSDLEHCLNPSETRVRIQITINFIKSIPQEEWYPSNVNITSKGEINLFWRAFGPLGDYFKLDAQNYNERDFWSDFGIHPLTITTEYFDYSLNFGSTRLSGKIRSYEELPTLLKEYLKTEYKYDNVGIE